jgi:hypothetical protein
MDSEVLKIVMMFIGIGFAGSLTYGAVALITAFSRRIERRGAGDVESLAGEVEELRQRVEEGEAVRARVQELEERLDFAERLLAQERDRARLPMGEGR